jgi:hypothetical protein
MFIDVQSIDVDRLRALLAQFIPMTDVDLELTIAYGQLSNPILSFSWKGDLLGVLGFIPIGILSGTAYLWLQHAPAASEHRLITGRIARLTIRDMLRVYPRMIGDCVADWPESVAWLASLGARFGPRRGRGLPFEIGAGT